MTNKQFIIHVSHPDRYLQNCFGDKTLVKAFEDLAQYALGKEKVLLVRSEHATIGVSRPNEKYWFYVSWKDAEARIKFQHWKQSERFEKKSMKQYKQACDEVAVLYQNSPEEFFTGIHKKGTETLEVGKNTPIKVVEKPDSQPQQVWVNSCENCYLKQNGQCSSLKGELCADYEQGFTNSKEYMDLWPKEMDAEKFKKKAGLKQEKYGLK